MSLTIRPAHPADYDAVARITAAAYLGAGHFASADHRYMREIMDVPARAAVAPVIVAERDGAVIGSATLAVHGDEWADIARAHELEFRLLVVDPAVQRSGAGQAMVEWIIAKAKAMAGITSVALTTGESWHGAHALYRKLGFARAPERDWPIPENGKLLLVYTLDL
ncbi:GNAT family N-acetyltransferase [Specibacter sp. NPDC057265]|uniref:GNAT family N-acetyltransferase n=1 Tax=Specibacter sp. NPDC057265 TaxID=3346075 RepID=UPI003628C7D9